MTRWIFLLILGLLSTCFSGCVNRENPYNKEWLSQLHNAGVEGKCLIVEFYTSWCIPCKILKNNIWENDSLMNHLSSKVTLLRVNAEKELGMALAIKYGVSTYPTLLIFDTSQTIVYEKIGIDGIDNPISFSTFISPILNGVNTQPANGMKQKLLPNSSYPDFYIQRLADRIQPDSTVVIDYFKNEKNLYSEVNWAVIRVLGGDSIQKFVTQHSNRYFKLYGGMLTSLFSKRIRKDFSEDIEAGDTVQFKKKLEPYLNTLKDVKPSKLSQRKCLIQLNFWSKTGDWNRFLRIWKNYRSQYGKDMDVRAAQYVDENTGKGRIRQIAESVLLTNLKQDPHNWKMMTGLANLWEKDRYMTPSIESGYTIHSALYSVNPNPDSLYQQAIKEANGDKRIISRIVGMRVQGAHYIPNEKGWLDAMQFYKNQTPEYYAIFHHLSSAGYYKKQGNWQKFAENANEVFNTKVVQSYQRNNRINEINAHTIYSFAETIEQNAEETGSIKLAISWMTYLSKRFPDEKAYKIKKKQLIKKMDSIRHEK